MNNNNTIYDKFNKFKENFLKNKKSIYTDKEFDNNDLEQIITSFVEKPDESDKNFDEKIKAQIGLVPEIKELFAHVIWLWSVFASDMKKESKKNDINKWLEKKIDDDFEFLFEHGIGSTGQHHKTNKPAELIYIILFIQKIWNTDSSDLNYVDYLKDLGNEAKNKKAAMYNILLHLLEPTQYERIASYGHKEKLCNFFESQLSELKYHQNDDIDVKLQEIRRECEKRYLSEYPYTFGEEYKKLSFNKNFDFYNPDLEKLWKSNIVLESKNMILHGAPGTGKTYCVENTIKNRLEFLEDENPNEQFKLVQFHPSYSYEDFIDGIKPSGIKNGNMEFELVNGEFKKMCIKAANELKNNPNTPKKFYFIADEINRAELSRVFGELLLCLEEDKRLTYKNGKWYGTKVKTQNSAMWKEEHAVVKEENEYYFGVPENIYFIGTMNDIDRSVESFDMALRRRFYWKHYKCDYDVIYDKFSSDKKIDEYIILCEKINSTITTDKGFNLGTSYELGHSYFMKLTKINNTEINKLWDNHIAPLLKEYLRAEYSENEIHKELKKLKKSFKLA